MPLTPGTRLGAYEILSPLGAGGMGEVYRARDLTLHRDVALKVLRADLASDPGGRRRFEQEALAASALNHPSIVHVYLLGEQESVHYIVMELVEGSTLRQRLAMGPFPVDELLPVGRQIAAGLAKAHAEGIVHRDLKPENLMLSDDGYAKILDFGLAKLRARTARGPEAATWTRGETMAGAVLGTVGYMSPEQAKGETADQRSDQFSLGAILYEMATGRRAFQRPTAAQTLSTLIEHDPEPLARLAPELPADFCSLVERCLAKDPARRYESTADLVAELTLIAAARRPDRAAAPPATRHPMVGHEDSLDLLMQGLRQAELGRGVLLCVAGEAGIGKTTLVETFLGRLATEGPSSWIVGGRCSERLAGSEAYLPFLDALEGLLARDAGKSLTSLMQSVAPSWYVHLRPTSPDAALYEGAGSPERMKRELGRFFEELCRRKTLVLFLDDLHWADVSTVDLLAYLGTRLDGLRSLILATYRTEELRLRDHPFLAVRRDLQARGVCREILLPFLRLEEMEQFLGLEFPGHRFPAELPALVHAKTEGSPLFMVDLLRYLRDQGVLAREEGTWGLARPLPQVERDLPQSVRSMIERKLDLLAEADRGLMLAASIEGFEFHSAVLSRALRIDPADVEERLQRLDHVHGLVQLVAEEQLPDRTLSLRYRFVHVLYQNALYGALAPTRRTGLSRAVAEALLECYQDESAKVASDLAILFEGARDPGRAAEHFSVAAQHASRVSAYREAIALVERALGLLEALPDPGTQARLELELQTTLGPALVATRGWAAPEVEKAYARARDLALEVDEPQRLFPSLRGLWFVHNVRDHLEVARRLSEQCMDLAEKARDSSLLLEAHSILGTTLTYLGELDSACSHLEAGIDLYDPTQHRAHARLYAVDPGVYCRRMLAWPLWLRGYPDQALLRAREAVALGRDLVHPFSLGYALAWGASLHAFRGETEAALDLLEELKGLATEQAFPTFAPWAAVMEGWALADSGRGEEGLAQMRSGLDQWETLGYQIIQSHWRALLAEACCRLGRTEEGLSALVEARAKAQHMGEAFWVAEIHRVEGELQAARGELELAEACFRQALRIAGHQGARSLELRAASSISRLLKDRGRREEGRELLGPVYASFTEGFDTRDLIEAAGLLAELR